MTKPHLHHAPRASARIIVIDDQRAHLDYLTALLKREHYDCHGFTNARHALTYIGRHDIDLVIADIFMPEMDGFEFLGEVRQRFPTLPIVMMSGGTARRSGDFFLNCTLRLGAVAALRKPLDNDTLLAVVERWSACEAAPFGELPAPTNAPKTNV